MSTMIPYGKQHITQGDIDAVIEALTADYLTQGPKIAEFEEKFAAYCGAEYAIAVSNGTAALHLAVLALGLKEDEYVICTPITFSASSNCIRYAGGNVLFADIDPSTYLIDPASIRETISRHSDKKIRGIIPVDFAGRLPQMDEIRKIAEEHNLWIIEDSCHSPGGYFIDNEGQQQLSGNGKFADISVFSFHPVKHIATGEGGMLTTNSKVLYEELLLLRSHGITRNPEQFVNSIAFANGNAAKQNDESYPGWYMEMQELGYNYRITDFQCALGISQLARADEGLQKRKSIAKKYAEAFASVPQIAGQSGYITGHAYHLYIIEAEDRRGLYDFLKSHSVFSQIHYIPVHLMPYYKEQGWKEGDFPHAERYYSRCLSLPMFPTLSDTEQQFVIDKVIEYYNA